jgi:MFS family permease
MSSPLLVASAVTGGLVIGFIPALVDSVRAPLRQQMKGSAESVDRILALFYLCWLPAMPLAGWLLDHARNKEILFFGLLGCGLGTTWLGLAGTPRSLVTSVIVLGAAYSTVAVAGIRLMSEALKFTTHPSRAGALNVGFVFVILGAVAGPGLVNRATRRWGLRQGLLYLSLALVGAAALVFLTPRAPSLELADPTPLSEVVTDVRLWLLGIGILLYFALENCAEVWPEPYLKEIGYRGRALTGALVVFWGAFTLLRAVTGWLPATGAEAWMLLGLVLASSFTMGNLVGANEHSSGSVGFWLTGACYGPLLPGLLALGMDLFPNLPAVALGMLLALSGLDTLVVRPLMVRLARRSSARTVMRVPTILALIMAAPLLVLALLRS